MSYSAARWERIVGSDESSIRSSLVHQFYEGEQGQENEPSLYSLNARSNSARFRSWCARAMARILSTSRSCVYFSASLLLRSEVTSSGYAKMIPSASTHPRDKGKGKDSRGLTLSCKVAYT